MEDVQVLLPDNRQTIFTLEYGSTTEINCPAGSIRGYAVNHDEADEKEYKTCLLPGRQTDPQADKKAVKKLMIACCLCFCFMVAELVGGILARSLAVMTDTAHLFTDFIGFLISFCALQLARRKSTKRLSFGWSRAEIIGVLFSVQLIWLVTGILVYLAIERVRTQNFVVNSTPMLITASFGVVVNLIISLVLHQVPHSHGHSHGGLESTSHGHSHGNINVRAAYIHAIGDLLQSFGVLTAALVIYFKPDYKIADPICTFVFSILVLSTTVFIFRDVVSVLMQCVPKSVDLDVLRHRLLAIPGVLECHNLYVWSLTADKHVCSVHITTDPELILHDEAVRGCHEVLSLYNMFHSITIQVEQIQSNTINS